MVSMAVVTLIRRYPLVVLTIVVGLVGLGAALAGAPMIVAWLFSIYALGIALWQVVGMIRDFARGQFGLDVLAIIAIVATVLVGEYVASLIIVLMLTGGEALEDFASQRAKRELDALMHRAPVIAHRLQAADGSAAVGDITVDEVQPGEVLLVRPAELVPVDAELLSPFGVFDESSITGESIPVEKQARAEVLSGAVNGHDAVQVRAVSRAEDSQYQRIVALVEEAAASKAPTVRLADRYAIPFTALSLAIGAAAWAVSGDPRRFAEVLVLATPCPLLIAAPVAFLGGMSRAARMGIVVKGAGVLEQLARARSVVFDKTGTLTRGRPELVAVRPEPGFTADELLAAVASVEHYSSHVLASAFISAAEDRGLAFDSADDARELAAHGVEATIGARQVAVGKFAFIAERTPDARRTAIAPGELAVYAAIDGRYAGSLIASDRLRPEAASTLDELRGLGIRRMVMLTGDGRETAEHVARELGLTEVRAECLPADKVAAVAGLDDRPVVMVGDGVNDAPVLAAADVGIAMGAKGATAASESASAVILVDDISRVADAVEVGRDTVRIALESIWIGIVASVVLMVVASFGLIPATVGAVIQEGLDVVTIVAALRAMRNGRRKAPAPLPAPVRVP